MSNTSQELADEELTTSKLRVRLRLIMLWTLVTTLVAHTSLVLTMALANWLVLIFMYLGVGSTAGILDLFYIGALVVSILFMYALCFEFLEPVSEKLNDIAHH